jgi:phenylpropionate dioxygenase-like ring-hydroxylating dioxygenase large terminal subunit
LPTWECSGYVWAWYGCKAPDHEPPSIPELGTHRRGSLRRFRLADPNRATTRRILENTYDPDHLIALHGLSVAGSPQITIPTHTHREGGDGEEEERFDATLTWPAYRGALGAVSNAIGLNAHEFTLRLRGWASCQQIEYFADDERLYQMVLAVTPVGEHHSIQHINAVVDLGRPGLLRWVRALAHRAEVQVAARQDLPIFDTLLPGDRHGIYVAGDEAVRQFRRFYQRKVEVGVHG